MANINRPDHAGRGRAALGAIFDNMIAEVASQPSPKTEAIAQADAHLSNVGLATYSELLRALQNLITAGDHTAYGAAIAAARAAITKTQDPGQEIAMPLESNQKRVSFDDLREAEWAAGRAIGAIKGFADKDFRAKLNRADFILAAVRSAGQFLCDPATPEADRQEVIDTLIANLYSAPT